MCIPHAPLRSTKNKQYSPGSSSGRQKNSTQISIFIVYKAYVSAARIVFVPLVSALTTTLKNGILTSVSGFLFLATLDNRLLIVISFFRLSVW